MRPPIVLITVLAVVVLVSGCDDDAGSESAVSTTPISTTVASTTTAPISTTTTPTATTTATTTSAGGETVQVADTATSIQDVLVTGAAKPDSAAEHDDVATYAPTGVGDTQVGRVAYRADVTLDVYYPPAYRFDTPLPAAGLPTRSIRAGIAHCGLMGVIARIG